MGKNKVHLKPKFVFYLSLSLFIFLSGCSYPSGVKTFKHITVDVIETVEADPTELLAIALETHEHSELAQKFWYTGWVRNYVQKRKTTSMYDGVMILPHGYIMNGRMSGVPFRYYKWDDHHYIWTNQDDWSRAEGVNEELNPFYGLMWWEPFFDRAVQLPNDKVLSKETQVFQIELTGQEWIEGSSTPLFDPLLEQIESTPGMDALIEKTTVTMTLWIGDEQYTLSDLQELARKKKINPNNQEEFSNWITENRFVYNEQTSNYHQHLIYQYTTLINMPIPGAGYMDQETFFRFFKYDDPGIQIKTPEEMEGYVKKKEETRK